MAPGPEVIRATPNRDLEEAANREGASPNNHRKAIVTGRNSTYRASAPANQELMTARSTQSEAGSPWGRKNQAWHLQKTVRRLQGKREAHRFCAPNISPACAVPHCGRATKEIRSTAPARPHSARMKITSLCDLARPIPGWRAFFPLSDDGVRPSPALHDVNRPHCKEACRTVLQKNRFLQPTFPPRPEAPRKPSLPAARADLRRCSKCNWTTLSHPAACRPRDRRSRIVASA